MAYAGRAGAESGNRLRYELVGHSLRRSRPGRELGCSTGSNSARLDVRGRRETVLRSGLTEGAP